MTLNDYNAMPEGDTKLAVRLAITMSWCVSLQWSITQGGLRVFVEDPNKDGWACKLFNPFTDPSIPYGLIGRGVAGVAESALDDFYAWTSNVNRSAIGSTKTHAIINVFCAEDPQGHWARFMKGGE